MPSIHAPLDAGTRVTFVVSPTLDLLNAMYFTFLAEVLDGIDGWPARTRKRLAPDLLAELEYLFTYPGHEPGVMGALNDLAFGLAEGWSDPEAFLDLVRGLPPGAGDPPLRPGIQGLVHYALRWTDDCDGEPAADASGLAGALAAGGLDVESGLSLYERPEELRARMLRLVRRFFDEHYRPELAERMALLQADLARRRYATSADPRDVTGAVAGREVTCFDLKPGGYREAIFTPSTDLGPYISCSDLGPIHGLYYAYQATDAVPAAVDDARLAQLYRALGDEQRLRILRLLAGREMYQGEIVEQTGLHQSIVSRHLAYLRAVDLVTVRRQNTMKFFALNPAVRATLDEVARLFVEPAPAALAAGQLTRR